MMTQNTGRRFPLWASSLAGQAGRHQLRPRTKLGLRNGPGDMRRSRSLRPGLNYTLLQTIRVENYRDGCGDHGTTNSSPRNRQTTRTTWTTLLAEAKPLWQSPTPRQRVCEYTRDPQLIRFSAIRSRHCWKNCARNRRGDHRRMLTGDNTRRANNDHPIRLHHQHKKRPVAAANSASDRATLSCQPRGDAQWAPDAVGGKRPPLRYGHCCRPRLSRCRAGESARQRSES